MAADLALTYHFSNKAETIKKNFVVSQIKDGIDKNKFWLSDTQLVLNFMQKNNPSLFAQYQSCMTKTYACAFSSVPCGMAFGGGVFGIVEACDRRRKHLASAAEEKQKSR